MRVVIIFLLLFCFRVQAMDIYQNQDIVPLSFTRARNSALVSGLTVTVVVKNATTGATLLASTSVPEVSAGSGIYTYNWTPNLNSDTECIATYTVGSNTYQEFFLITSNTSSRSI